MNHDLGTIKVAWTGKNPAILHARMFDQADAGKAIAFANSKREAMVMRLISQEGLNYSWEILPGGKYSLYIAHVYHHRLLSLFRPRRKNRIIN